MIRTGAAMLLVTGMLLAQTDTDKRLAAATEVFRETMAMADQSIPQDLLNKAHCVVIVPGLKKGAFIVGAKYGRGFAFCRIEGGQMWSAPGTMRVEGGSFGFQIGGSETDVIMLVMNAKGKDKLLASKFTVGGDASAAAGPLGRTAAAQTDAQMRAELLTYSRARGVFAGISLDGATMRQDWEATKELYGEEVPNQQIMSGDTPVPSAARDMVGLLTKYSTK